MELDDLIYDRTQEDVDEVISNPLTENKKGAYNYTDMNRIEEWIYYLKYFFQDLGYDTSNLNPKMDNSIYNDLITNIYEYYSTNNYTYEEILTTKKGGWAITDIPTYDDFKNRYLNNIEILKDMFPIITKDIDDINFEYSLNFNQANIIEKIINEVNNNWDKAGQIVVKYIDEDGNKIADDLIINGTIGDEYNVTIPEITDYSYESCINSYTGDDTLSGTLINGAITITMTYSKIMYYELVYTTINEEEVVSDEITEYFTTWAETQEYLATLDVYTLKIIALHDRKISDETNDISWAFENLQKLVSIDLSQIDISNVTLMMGIFYNCTSLTNITFGDNFDTSSVTDMSWMFVNCSSLTELNISNFDIGNVTTLSCMFSGCTSLTNITFGDNFNTGNVTDMHLIFQSCSNLTELDLSNFDTSNVTDMSGMFQHCRGLTNLNVSNFDTSKVVDMSYMFSVCLNLTELNISNFDTSNVVMMECMFQSCSNLTELDLSNFSIKSYADISWMFSSCDGLKTIDLRNATFDNVTSTSLFNEDYNLETVYVGSEDAKELIDERLGEAGLLITATIV